MGQNNDENRQKKINRLKEIYKEGGKSLPDGEAAEIFDAIDKAIKEISEEDANPTNTVGESGYPDKPKLP